jgi:hypothetical protein
MYRLKRKIYRILQSELFWKFVQKLGNKNLIVCVIHRFSSGEKIKQLKLEENWLNGNGPKQSKIKLSYFFCFPLCFQNGLVCLVLFCLQHITEQQKKARARNWWLLDYLVKPFLSFLEVLNVWVIVKTWQKTNIKLCKICSTKTSNWFVFIAPFKYVCLPVENRETFDFKNSVAHVKKWLNCLKRDSSLFCLIYSLGLFSHLDTLVGAVSHPPLTMRVKDGEWKIFDEEIKKRRFRWHNGYLLYDKGSVPRTSIWTTYRVQTLFI